MLKKPLWVAFVSSFLLLLALNQSGGLTNLFRMQAQKEFLVQEQARTDESLRLLEARIQEAKDPSFLERKAIEGLDMASRDDLIFIFSD
jgi:cell division protein FtsB